jgi:hypothetical protein
MLKWSETDFTEFFGAISSYDADACSHSFEVVRDGLRLLVTLFDMEQAVYVSIFRDGLSEPTFTVRREHCTHAQIAAGADFRRCFEAGTTKHLVTEMGIPPVLARGVRVYVEPHFKIELIEPRHDAN